MELPKISHQNNYGFTLIEIVIAISITALIFAFGFFISLDSYRGYIFRSERNLIVSVLNRARGQALSNINESKHGVCYIEPNYIIFEGSTCDPSNSTNEEISANTKVVSSSDFSGFPIVFDQVSGKTLSVNIIVSDGIRSETISINSEGTINW